MKQDRKGEIRYPFDTPPVPGEALEVADGILWMRLPLPMALDHVNVFALEEPDGWAIIDTGFDSPETRAIWERLISGPMGGRPITRVLITHHHPDHIGLAGWFQRRGAELLTTRTAWIYARMLVLDEQDRPSPEEIAFWQGAGMAADLLEERRNERPFNFADVVAPLPHGFTRLRDGDMLRLGRRDWLIRTGDGHAPEHATLWQKDGPLILGGDQLLPSISANIGVYANEPMADPLAEWLQSCRRFMPHAQADQLVLPGHKLPFTGLPLRLHQMVVNHEGALMRLLDHLSRPRRAAECFLPVFKREITGSAYGLALIEAMAHLNHLLHRGAIRRTMGKDGAWRWERNDR
ncbi:MAG: MBL fold metallo-hydrolase [Pseudorhodobacter sp.]